VKLLGATPVIFLTAGNYDNELKQRGIGVFLHKPFGIEYLLSLARALLTPHEEPQK
jgi:DNA-binding response OmpR family regulator